MFFAQQPLAARAYHVTSPSQTGVFLSVSDDATIVGSHHSRDYPLDPSSWALSFAQTQSNIGIIGNIGDTANARGGVINGDYEAYIDHYDPGISRQNTARENLTSNLMSQ